MERDFADEAEVSIGLKEHVWKELAPVASSAAMTGSEKYEAAAKVARWQGADNRHIADLWLRAAWCCVDECDIEAERYFRRLAARWFESALAMFDGVPRTERAVLTYLVGELWRRIGDVKLADEWFDKVPGEIVDAGTQQWVVLVADQQRREPQEWFS